MTELQTLKGNYSCIVNIKGERFISETELRQEAIKWIKHLSQQEIKGILTDYQAEVKWDISERERRSQLAMINWIKHFFNIEEKDLQ